MEAVYQCSCIREDSLHRLQLSYDNSTLLEEGLEFNLKKLGALRTLWKLVLACPLASNCNGTIIQFPPNVVSMSLYSSAIEGRDDLMDILGELPKLKQLILDWDSYLGTQLSCTASSFPQLQDLRLRGLGNLEEWRMEEGAMARLSKMWIHSCPRLRRLPESIRSITTLKELKITEMPKEFCRRIGYQGEDHYILQHIRSVIVSDDEDEGSTSGAED